MHGTPGDVVLRYDIRALLLLRYTMLARYRCNAQMLSRRSSSIAIASLVEEGSIAPPPP
jgi:hypothetical protein